MTDQDDVSRKSKKELEREVRRLRAQLQSPSMSLDDLEVMLDGSGAALQTALNKMHAYRQRVGELEQAVYELKLMKLGFYNGAMALVAHTRQNDERSRKEVNDELNRYRQEFGEAPPPVMAQWVYKAFLEFEDGDAITARVFADFLPEWRFRRNTKNGEEVESVPKWFEELRDRTEEMGLTSEQKEARKRLKKHQATKDYLPRAKNSALAKLRQGFRIGNDGTLIDGAQAALRDRVRNNW